MKQRSLSSAAIFSKQLMATVSVMIVLLILGIFAMTALSAGSFSDALKSRMGYTVVMSDNVSDEATDNVKKLLDLSPSTNTVSYITADETLSAWERDNGENLIDVLGVNPFGDMFEVTVNPTWATSDSINAVVARLEGMEGIEEISTTTQVVDEVNNAINLLTLIFLPLALALLIVSAVLINNTVRLTVYSSRFLIHTMKLVGATGSFIRRPFINTGLTSGFVAGILASVLLVGLTVLVHAKAPGVAEFTSWSDVVMVSIGMIVVGVIICSIAASLATNKYLRLDYDKMF